MNESKQKAGTRLRHRWAIGLCFLWCVGLVSYLFYRVVPGNDAISPIHHIPTVASLLSATCQYQPLPKVEPGVELQHAPLIHSIATHLAPDTVDEVYDLNLISHGAFVDEWGHPIRIYRAPNGQPYLHGAGADGDWNTDDDVRLGEISD